MVESWSVVAGKRRTRLGLRTLVNIDELVQSIDLENRRASNQVFFSVRGFTDIKGSLSIEATWVRDPLRVVPMSAMPRVTE